MSHLIHHSADPKRRWVFPEATLLASRCLADQSTRMSPAQQTVLERLADDEDVDAEDGRTMEELENDIKRQNAKNHAVMLEMVRYDTTLAPRQPCPVAHLVPPY